MKTLKKYLPLIVIAIFALAASSCSKIHDISITSYKITSLSLNGVKSANVTLELGVHNPTLQFSLTDNHAIIYHKGEALGMVDATDVTVPARCDGVYPVTGTATLADNTSILKVMTLARNFNAEDYTVDLYTVIVLKNGTKIKYNKKSLPLTDFISTDEQ